MVETNKASQPSIVPKRLGPIEVKVILLPKTVYIEKGTDHQGDERREVTLPIGPFTPIKINDPPTLVEGI